MALVTPHYTLHNADCLDILAGLPDASIDAVITDPPYFRVKSDPWDRQWRTADAFAVWIGQVLDQFARVLKPNGSLYLFASPQMAARIEVLIAERMQVLNHIVWAKPSGRHLGTCKAQQRHFFPQTERILFAEHYAADKVAKGEAGYAAKCDELRTFVFEPLRQYLDSERERAGWTRAQIDKAWSAKRGGKTSGGMSSHWFGRSQWALPSREAYTWLQALLNTRAPGHLAKPHPALAAEYSHLQAEYQVLRQQYDELKEQYTALRRPFRIGLDMPHTDVWGFKPVQAYKGKHPCEKPLDLMRHIVRSSTRPGQVVLDAFAGSGATGLAAIDLGCQFIGIEQDADIYARTVQRLAEFVATAHTIRAD